MNNSILYKSFLIFALAGLSCNNTNNAAMQNGTFDWQGHRGCRGLYPENTIEGMLHALSYPIKTLELDVVITKDNQVVLSHEPFFNYEITTLPNGDSLKLGTDSALNIYKMDYAEMQAYDVGLRVHPRFLQQKKIKAIKPLLKDVFNAVKEYCNKKKISVPNFNIETKCLPIGDLKYHPMPKDMVDLIMKEVAAANLSNKVTIQSFDKRSLQYLHEAYPKIKAVLLVEEKDAADYEAQIKMLGFKPFAYSPHYSLVTSNLVHICNINNVKLIPWTVNDKPTMDKLIAMGVDGIITDYPNLIKP
jgi:glycerophosphoryl diester phosphodiesterase